MLSTSEYESPPPALNKILESSAPMHSVIHFYTFVFCSISISSLCFLLTIECGTTGNEV